MLNPNDFRLISYKILLDTFSTRRWAKESIEDSMSGIDDPHGDIRKVYELVYGILRNKNLIDYALSMYVLRPNEDLRLQNILRIGYYQIKFMDSIPDHAAVNVCVDMASKFVHEKTAGFVNAVLRKAARFKDEEIKIDRRDEKEYLRVKYSFEPWMVDFFVKNYPAEAEEIMAGSNAKPPLFIRTNTLKTGTEELAGELKSEKIMADELPLCPGALLCSSYAALKSRAFERGDFFVQDLSSQLLTRFAAPSSGETIIDACSAPGGKSAGLYMLSKGKAKIAAVENNPKRSSITERNFVRLGIKDITVIIHDATKKLVQFDESADKVLVDAPCSALGVIRRHPEKKWCLEERELKEYPPVQKALLENAAKWVKKGGELFYSTCTLNPAENQRVAEWFLEKHAEFKKEDPSAGSKKLAGFARNGFFLSLPGNREGMDGFFIAKFVKKRGGK